MAPSIIRRNDMSILDMTLMFTIASLAISGFVYLTKNIVKSIMTDDIGDSRDHIN